MKRKDFEEKRSMLIKQHDYKMAVLNKLTELISNDENVMFDLEELIKKHTGEILNPIERSGHVNFKWIKEQKSITIKIKFKRK